MSEPDDVMDTIAKLLIGISQPGDMLWEDEVDGVFVTTIFAKDLKCYETAVRSTHTDNKPHPVERYDEKDAAEAGQKKWLDLMQDAIYVTELGYGPLIEPTIHKIR